MGGLFALWNSTNMDARLAMRARKRVELGTNQTRGRRMARRVRGRKARSGGVPQNNARLLVGIIFAACLLGFYAYKHWNTEPQVPIVGKAWVIDGDTIVISDTHIRLEGIDAPESDQTCTDPIGKTWPCGKTAANQLREHIRGEELTCWEVPCRPRSAKCVARQWRRLR